MVLVLPKLPFRITGICEQNNIHGTADRRNPNDFPTIHEGTWLYFKAKQLCKNQII